MTMLFLLFQFYSMNMLEYNYTSLYGKRYTDRKVRLLHVISALTLSPLSSIGVITGEDILVWLQVGGFLQIGRKLSIISSLTAGMSGTCVLIPGSD